MPEPAAGRQAGGMWTSLAFAVVGAIHLMPIAPVFVPETLARLYGITPGEPTLLVLLRHRALLLALVGILCLWASWAAPVRPAALLAAAINVVGFLSFYALYGNPAGALRTIAIVDLIALPPLAFAVWSTLVRA
ncbi:MAG: phosphopantetheine adenylyltransferase [Rhodospirillaceae bacterium]|nr:phosphopantetheine adenylyltransferase [Rhodospirillaceae bacterium]